MGTHPQTSLHMVLIAIVQTELAKRSYHLHDECTAADLADAILSDMENITDIAYDRMRLIAQGRELHSGEKLKNLGEFYFKKSCIILREVNEQACREWQRSGRCTNKNCSRKASHTMMNSPRYVQHQNLPHPRRPHTTPWRPIPILGWWRTQQRIR